MATYGVINMKSIIFNIFCIFLLLVIAVGIGLASGGTIVFLIIIAFMLVFILVIAMVGSYIYELQR